MPCYNPTRTIMDGDHRIAWNKDWKWAHLEEGHTRINVPCRKCVGCGQATAREWSVRGYHHALTEAIEWQDPDTKITTEIPNSCVITLTYDSQHIPTLAHLALLPGANLHNGVIHAPGGGGILVHEHFQRFIGRLRADRRRKGNKEKLSYYMCGEYGGKTSRPHFHVVIFGHDFGDIYEEYDPRNGQVHRMSYELDDLWSQPANPGEPSTKIGRATVEPFTFAGAGYVSGYVAKKSYVQGHVGPTLETHENHQLKVTPITPEYRQMSRRPGIAQKYLIQNNLQKLHEIYATDEVKISKWTFHPPKYYDRVLEHYRPDLISDLKRERQFLTHRSAEEWTKERCSAAEINALNSLQARRDSL